MDITVGLYGIATLHFRKERRNARIGILDTSANNLQIIYVISETKCVIAIHL